MTRMSVGLHPGFDELSAHADRTDLAASRSRVGRHVMDCAACSATLTEIRAMGASARESRVPGVPAGLWARIERVLDEDGAIPAPAAPASERAVVVPVASEVGAAEPTSPAKRNVFVKRAVLGLVAVTAVATAVLVTDARKPLAAATPRRLQADREYARPGAAITFHYRPIPSLAGQQTLTVWMFDPAKHLVQFDPVLERAGTLRRASALQYAGTVTMPDSSSAVIFVVGDSAGNVLDREEVRAHLACVVLAADSLGRPRLDALVAALGAGRTTPDRATALRWTARLREFYPTAPETWIFGAMYRSPSAIGDIVKLFESRERQYCGWHDRLEHRRGLSEISEVMMANLGWEMMDTARAEFWTSRLIEDHPTSAYAASLWISRYRDVPRDSIDRVLQAFEPFYLRAKLSRDGLERAIWLAQRSGDSVLIRRWTARVDPRGVSWLLGDAFSELTRDAAARADATTRLRDALTETDAETRAGPTLFGQSENYAWYTKQRLRTRLAAVQILDGNLAGGRAALDSIAAEEAARPSCWLPETMRWRAEAERRLGLMREAQADLAYVATTENWRNQLVSDSASVLLGSAYSKASWDSALVSGRAAHQKCWADAREARRAASG